MFIRKIFISILALLFIFFYAVYPIGAKPDLSEPRISICIRAYPREVVLDANITIIPKGIFTDTIRRLAFLFTADNLYNASEGSFIMEASYRTIELPINIAATLNFTYPSGRGWLHMLLNPVNFQGLQEVRVDYNFTLREAALVSLDATFNASIIMEYASSNFIEMIEDAVNLSRTDDGMEILRQRMRNYFGEWLSLKALTLHFNRDRGLFTGLVRVDVNTSAALASILQIVPSAPQLPLKEAPKVSKLYLTLSVDKSSLKIYAEWRLNERLKRLLDGFYGLSLGIQPDLTRFLLGVRRSLRIEASYVVTENKLNVSIRGLRFIFRESPENTFNAIMEVLRDIESKNLGIIEKIIVSAGSDQDYETVIWHAGSTYRVLELSSPCDFSGSMTAARNRWGISDYEMYTKDIQVGGSSYIVTVASNSTVANIVLWSQDTMAFNVEGRDGTLGALNATIPRAVLGGADLKSIKVTVGGVEAKDAIINVGEDVVWVYVTYIHNVYTVIVKWTLPQQTIFTTQTMLFIAVGAVIGAIIGIIIVVRRR